MSEVCALVSVGHMRFNLCKTKQLFVAVSTGKWLVFVKPAYWFLLNQATFKRLRPVLRDSVIFIHKLNES